jgi:hypothetical protein
MGRGLGDVQTRILSLLHEHYGGPLTVGQLADLIHDDAESRALLVSMRRAIHGLHQRGLVDELYMYVHPRRYGARPQELACVLPGSPLPRLATRRRSGVQIESVIRELMEDAQTEEGQQRIAAYLDAHLSWEGSWPLDRIPLDWLLEQAALRFQASLPRFDSRRRPKVKPWFRVAFGRAMKRLRDDGQLVIDPF